MRRVVVLVCLAAVTVLPQPGRAACAAPSIRAMPAERRAGQLVLVTGEDWVSGCDDVVGDECTGGCAGCPDVVEPEKIEEVVVELRGEGAEPVRLYTADVSRFSSFAEEVRLPRDLEPGRYRIVAITEQDGYWARARLVIVD